MENVFQRWIKLAIFLINLLVLGDNVRFWFTGSGQFHCTLAGYIHIWPNASANARQQCCSIGSPFSGVNGHQLDIQHIGQDLPPQGTPGASARGAHLGIVAGRKHRPGKPGR